MDELDRYAKGFHALGSNARLQIYIELLRHEPEGLNVKDLQESVDMKASTLAHHLRTLVEAGLVRQEQRGKESINRAVRSELESLCSGITSRCCEAGVCSCLK